jgi:hypothetical protein
MQHNQTTRVALAFFVCVCSLLFLLSFLVLPATRAHADAMSVSITPPLFQLTIGPGEAWASSLKIINNNSYDESYYAQVMDMQPSGEEGASKFIPLVNESPEEANAPYALAHWITVSPEPIVVKAGTTASLPFTVDIPTNAEPGGHYAAILVGTQPNGVHATGTLLKVSSYVSSLMFVRIKGDVTESGRIREFFTSQSLYQTPKVDFTLRFENTGNTHVRPQGSITLYNMWGQDRGQVLINQDADGNFGNVLPQSIRKFDFSWKGDGNPFDIGLYSAVVTLAYGEGNKQNVTAKTYFWVVPVVPVAIGLVSTVLFIGLFLWFVRRYIRRALTLEQQRFGVVEKAGTSVPVPPPSLMETLMEPVREGVIDLRAARAAKSTQLQSMSVAQQTAVQSPRNAGTATLVPLTMGQFAWKYKLFFGFVSLLIMGSIGLWIYFDKVLTKHSGFQITNVQIHAEPVNTDQKVHVEGQ